MVMNYGRCAACNKLPPDDCEWSGLCPDCRRLMELGRAVEAKRVEYQRRNEAHTVEDWQMEILNWLDGLEAKGER